MNLQHPSLRQVIIGTLSFIGIKLLRAEHFPLKILFIVTVNKVNRLYWDTCTCTLKLTQHRSQGCDLQTNSKSLDSFISSK